MMRRCVRDRMFLLVLVIGLSIRTLFSCARVMTNGEGMTKIGN